LFKKNKIARIEFIAPVCKGCYNGKIELELECPVGSELGAIDWARITRKTMTFLPTTFFFFFSFSFIRTE